MRSSRFRGNFIGLFLVLGVAIAAFCWHSAAQVGIPHKVRRAQFHAIPSVSDRLEGVAYADDGMDLGSCALDIHTGSTVNGGSGADCYTNTGLTGFNNTSGFTINHGGVYVMTRDEGYTGTGDAITVSSTVDDSGSVVIDLNGYTLSCTGSCATANTIGVLANGSRNVLIENGTIKGFYYQVYISSLNVHVRNVRLVTSDGGVGTYGIFVSSSANDVVMNDNFIQGMYDGIDIASASGTFTAANNVIMNSGSTGSAIYVYGAGTNNTFVFLDNNFLMGGYDGIYSSNATTKYRNTITTGFTTAYSGGTSIGGNNN